MGQDFLGREARVEGLHKWDSGGDSSANGPCPSKITYLHDNVRYIWQFDVRRPSVLPRN